MIKFIKKYRHGLVIAIYALLYLITFNYLENRTVFSYQYHVIDTVFDSSILVMVSIYDYDHMVLHL